MRIKNKDRVDYLADSGPMSLIDGSDCELDLEMLLKLGERDGGLVLDGLRKRSFKFRVVKLLSVIGSFSNLVIKKSGVKNETMKEVALFAGMCLLGSILLFSLLSSLPV